MSYEIQPYDLKDKIVRKTINDANIKLNNPIELLKIEDP